MTTIVFIVALALGGIASWQIFNWRYSKKLNNSKKEAVKIESNILLERIEKVFKVVLAEGYFTEIYDHNTQKDFWGLGLFQTNNKALVVAKAKVSIGFDFSKMVFRKDETNRKLIIEEFAPAEIISIDTDYKFYDINQGFLTKFNNEDYTTILAESKKLMQEKAYESDLPQIASNQISVMVKQLATSMNWDVEVPAVLPISKNIKLLS